MRRLIFALAVWTTLMGGLSGAKAGALDRSTDGQDVTLAISSPFSDLPPGRMVPFRVTIRNDRNSAGTWHVLFQASASFMPNSGATILEQDMSVAANASGIFDVLVPLPISAMERYGGLSLHVGVTGPGFADRGMGNQFFADFYSSAPTYSGSKMSNRSPFTIIGNDVLGTSGTSPLESLYKDRGDQFYGSAVDVEQLPPDWRAYVGVASFILKDTEWLSLGPSQREAVIGYVAMGGHLTLLTSENSDARIPQLQLPSPDGKPGPYGFGTITLESNVTFPPDADTLNRFLTSNPANAAQNVDSNFSTWPLRLLVGKIAVSSAFILLFVIFFGTLIGPLNLFVFAKGKNRFRLFWTTPLISIIASVALIVGILATDGLGGSGRQVIVIYSLPGLNREAVIQEQVSRTAVLLSRNWHTDQNYLITPVSTRSMDNAIGASNERTDDSLTDMSDASNTYRQSGDEFSGDWFRSRSVAGQYLQAMRPSRSVLTVLNPQALASGQAPVIVSSFPQEMTQVFLLDANWHYWTCAHLEPGRKQTCTRSNAKDFNVFWNEAGGNAGGELSPLLSRARDKTGCFYATGAPSPDEKLATLGEIRWQVAQGIYLGPWVNSTLPEGAP